MYKAESCSISSKKLLYRLFLTCLRRPQGINFVNLCLLESSSIFPPRGEFGCDPSLVAYIAALGPIVPVCPPSSLQPADLTHLNMTGNRKE